MRFPLRPVETSGENRDHGSSRWKHGFWGATLTKTEFLELLTNGEDSGIEFKTDVVENRALAKELVALANLQGGHVLLGVDDDGNVQGLSRTDPPTGAAGEETNRRSYRRLEEWVMQACRDKIRPEIIPYFRVLRDVAPDRDVAVVSVNRSWSVHHLWHNQRRTYYVRVGSLSREASPEELARLFQQRGIIRPELAPVSGTSIEALDRRLLKDYFERVRDQDVPAADPSDAAREEWETLLINTEFLHEDDPHPATVAGLTLFGANPSRYLPQAKIDAAAYFGVEKDYDARERRTLRGPIVPLIAADGVLRERGLVEQAVEFVRRNIETTKLEDGIRRTERWDYPPEAVREVVVNAIVHRDYLLSGTDIELSVYADRMEVVSPGRLANGITPARMRAGCRSARNELLKDVMRDYGYLEHMGMGVPRKIVRGMREHNGTEPDLVEDGERFTVRLWKEARTNRP